MTGGTSSRSSTRRTTASGTGGRAMAWAWRSRGAWPSNWAAISLSRAPSGSGADSPSPSRGSLRDGTVPSRPRLLVVEDDPTTSLALKVLFTRRGWEVAVASSVAEGLVLVDQLPACIILDVMLPDGDGTAILRKVRD